MPDRWTIVVPVKGTAAAKSRLGGSPDLALAIALDTVEAAMGAARVIVVTPAGEPFAGLGAATVADPGGGLGAAIAAGLAAAGEGRVGVLLGDVPALQASELEAALRAAERHPLAFVPDADGTGTTLVTALRSRDHSPRFGVGSAAAHRAEGYVELAIPVDSGLRRDVDEPWHLEELAPRLGPRSRSFHMDGLDSLTS